MSKSLYKERIEECREKLREATAALSEAGPSSKGEFKILIRSIKDSIEFFQKLYDEAPDDLPSNRVRPTVFILSSTKKKILQNLGNGQFEYINEERYDEDHISLWKPFVDGESILHAINYLKENYPLTEFYIDKDEDYKHEEYLDENAQTSIGIIDVFAINNDNIRFAQCFDRSHTHLIIPHCKTIIQHANLNVYFTETRNRVFERLNGKITKRIPCGNYLPSVTEHDVLINHLILLFEKFVVKKQIAINSPVRNINTSLI